jgi:hypothetical protein
MEMSGMDTTGRVWRKDFANAANSIRPEWLITLDDGFVGIRPKFRQRPEVDLYARLCQVGYARGWL